MYGCSFAANFFFEKIFVVFTKYTLFAGKNVFIQKKKIIEKNINENVKKIYLISEINKQKINLS